MARMVKKEVKPRVCGFCDMTVKRGDPNVGLILVICDWCKAKELSKHKWEGDCPDGRIESV